MHQFEQYGRVLSLLDYAALYWFQRVLSTKQTSDGKHFIVDYEVYVWGTPRTKWEGYPNLSTCTWPG